MKRSVILTDRLGPDILSAFWTKGQVLHRERAHLKVPGFSIVLNVLLTRKLPTFLSRLKEISGGCEKTDGQFTLSTPLINQSFVYHSPTDAAPQLL